jgi:electron transfer flavoprotein alpha subunit
MKICSYGAVEFLNKKVIINNNCCKCGICIAACPCSAINFIRDKQPILSENETHKGIWVFCEQTYGKAKRVSYELLGEGRRLADILQVNLSAVIIGNNIGDEARKLIAYGADIVYKCEAEILENFNDEIYIDTLTNLIEIYKPEIVLFGATVYSRSIAPRIASRLNTGLTADCTKLEINSDNRVLLQTRPAFGGNLMATIICEKKRPQMATVRPMVMKALTPNYSRKGKIIAHTPIISEKLSTKVIKRVKHLSSIKNISDAEIIVAVGRGIGEAKNIKMIEDLAQLLGASVGASRAVVDAGWLEYDQQIGQTGKTVRPKIYFACGISGAIQHLAGMSSSEMIIAINKDSEAPIFKLSTYGIVGDIMQVIPALIEELKTRIADKNLNIKNRFKKY